MPLFSKILCPVDFEENSIAALDIASELARERGATIYLLHVARVPADQVDAPLPAGPNPRWEQEARKKLADIAHDKLGGRVRYQIHVISGVPDADVIRAAKDLDAELVVMATHGRTGLSHLILGSVAERVMREAKCPVLTIRPTAKPS